MRIHRGDRGSHVTAGQRNAHDSNDEGLKRTNQNTDAKNGGKDRKNSAKEKTPPSQTRI